MFFHVYFHAQQGAPETVHMTCVILANQFAAMKQEIKVNVAGIEGSLTRLLQSHISVIQDIATIVMPQAICQGIVHYEEEVLLWSHKEEGLVTKPAHLRSYQ